MSTMVWREVPKQWSPRQAGGGEMRYWLTAKRRGGGTFSLISTRRTLGGEGAVAEQGVEDVDVEAVDAELEGVGAAGNTGGEEGGGEGAGGDGGLELGDTGPRAGWRGGGAGSRRRT